MAAVELVKTFNEDNRTPITDLYSQFELLVTNGRWTTEIITSWVGPDADGYEVSLPIRAYISPNNGSGPWLWVIAGIHGEEPAGVLAIAQEVETLMDLARSGIPIVCLPLVNPGGYIRNQRFPYSHRNNKNASLGDSEHLLLNEDRSGPRKKRAASKLTREITGWVLTSTRLFPPSLVFDHHEDQNGEPGDWHANASYVYFLGKLKLKWIAAETASIL